MKLLLLLLLLFPLGAIADDAPLLDFVPERSRITFIATQNHVPVEGWFTRFNAVIHFATDNLPASSVKTDIDLASVQADYDEVADNLKGGDWFDTKNFPKAVFESHNFTHLEGNRYSASGTLMLHGHSIPVTLPFVLTQEEGGIVRIEGETTLKRSDFTVGQGEWAKSDVVEDNVTVKITAVAKSVKK